MTTLEVLGPRHGAPWDSGRSGQPAAQRPEPARLWLRAFHPQPWPRATLVVFPPAGGAASFAAPLSAALQPDIQVLGVQYPGRQDRVAEAPVADLEDLADRVAGVLAGIRWQRLVLLGHSMGASLAFEVARRLEQAAPDGSPVRALVVSGRESPGSPRDRPFIHALPDSQLMEALAELDSDAVAALTHPELREMLLPVLRSDLAASEGYTFRAGAALECQVLALAGSHDPAVRVAEVLRWREVTCQFAGAEVYPGGHFFLRENLGSLAPRLRALIDPAGAGIPDAP